MEKPKPEDCCGSGCNPCIFDVYQKSKNDLKVDVFNPVKYTPFLLKNVEKIIDQTFLYTFQAIDQKMNPLIVKINLDKSNYAILRGDSVSRPYTILLNDFLEIGCFQVIIKLYPNGKMSEYLRNVKKGDFLFWRGSYSHFEYEKTSHILLIGCGTGILPLFNIAKSLTADENCETMIHIIGCFRNIETILLRKELHELTKFWNCTVEYFIQELSTDTLFYKEKITFQKLDDTYLKKIKFSYVISCGTDLFNQFVQNVANNLKIKIVIL